MEIDEVLPTMLDQVAKFLKTEDEDLIYEFLAHHEVGLAIEFLCDKLIEYNSAIPESLARKIQLISSTLELNPSKTWEHLLVEEGSSQIPTRLNRDGPDLLSSIKSLFQEFHKMFESRDSDQIEEFISQNEIELATDLLCHCLIEKKIPIRKRTLNQIRILLLDAERDPNAWKGFAIKED